MAKCSASLTEERPHTDNSDCTNNLVFRPDMSYSELPPILSAAIPNSQLLSGDIQGAIHKAQECTSRNVDSTTPKFVQTNLQTNRTHNISKGQHVSDSSLPVNPTQTLVCLQA